MVHLTAEYYPYAQTGGLAEAVQGMARAQASRGLPTLVILPLYGPIRETHPEIEPLAEAFQVQVGPRTETARLHHVPPSPGEPHVLFVESGTYFDRPGIYGNREGDFPDNPRRFALFCRAALQALPELFSPPAILHAHDWHAALAPVYLRNSPEREEPFYRELAAVLSVHNAGFQGHLGRGALADLGLPESLFHGSKMEWYDQVNLLKGGLVFSDFVATVSPGHAHELRTRAGGFGLHETFTALQDRFVGILNGIDVNEWNPATDPHIAAPYNRDELSGKRTCKRWLQENSELAMSPEVPLFGMSARLAEQKGIDLILGANLEEIGDAQFVFLGEGSEHYENALSELAGRAPDRIVTRFDFTHLREHQLLAGADALLMPSLYEPCGLTQMRAQRYGTLPVARRVGGLADTVEDQVTGVLFDEYEPWALRDGIQRVLDLYPDRDAWDWHVREAMARNFGWDRSVDTYLDLYELALARRAELTTA